jgi:hypothetical protein
MVIYPRSFLEQITIGDYGCWFWRGNCLNGHWHKPEYVTDDGRVIPAYVFAWEHANGRQVPRWHLLYRRCYTLKCVNPGHRVLRLRGTGKAVSHAKHIVERTINQLQSEWDEQSAEFIAQLLPLTD